jgi:hypothetical protein
VAALVLEVLAWVESLAEALAGQVLALAEALVGPVLALAGALVGPVLALAAQMLASEEKMVASMVVQFFGAVLEPASLSVLVVWSTWEVRPVYLPLPRVNW